MKKILVACLLGVVFVGSMVVAGSFEDLLTRTYIQPNLLNLPTASLPTASVPGRLAYDSTLNQITLDNGSAWGSPLGANLVTGAGTNTVGTELRLKQSTAPTITTGGGTSPSVSGSDSIGVITLGTGSPATPFTMTFNGTWASAPSCIVIRNTGTAANVVQVVATTTTTMVVTVATAVAASDKFNYFCGAGV